LIIGSLVYKPLWYGLAICLVAYIITLLAGTTMAIKKGGFAVGVITLLIFPILHFSYGLGSLVGIWRFVIRQGKRAKPVSQTKITR
jgi:hypothetical protein